MLTRSERHYIFSLRISPPKQAGNGNRETKAERAAKARISQVESGSSRPSFCREKERRIEKVAKEVGERDIEG